MYKMTNDLIKISSDMKELMRHDQIETAAFHE